MGRDTMVASHEIADHTSELRLRLRAPSLGELLVEAALALGEIQARGVPQPRGDGAWHTLDVSAPDRAGLLAEWLNELIYLAETERVMATEFELERVGPHRAVIRARGAVHDRIPGLVKAATLHDLRVEDVPGGLEGEVVLDV